MREIDVETLHTVLGRAASPTEPAPTLVDVREGHEFVAGHVPGAVNIPLTEFVDRVTEVTTAPGEVFVICAVGARSAQVTDWLGQQGYDVANVAGGTDAWRASGYPLA